jgi:hypothetical protein
MKKLFAVLASFAILAAFAVPASATEGDVEARIQALEEAFQCSWKFYGSARMATFWEKDDAVRTKHGVDDDTDMNWALQGNSRIGARVNLGDVSGRFEYGHTSSNGATLRLLYGEWNFGAGKLLIGQDYTPMTFWISNQVWGDDNDLLGFGQQYHGREQQVKLTFGNFQIAAINPDVNADDVGLTGFDDVAAVDTDSVIPKLVASYDINAGPLKTRITGAYQTFDVVRLVGTSEDEQSVDSWQIAGAAIYDIGPFFLKGGIYYGENLRNINQSTKAEVADRAYWFGNDMLDSETLGFALVAGFKVNDMLLFEAGYGQANNEVDEAGFKLSQDVRSYYLNATINLAKNVFIVPEVGVVDYDEVEAAGGGLDYADAGDRGDMTYFGAKWQINF